MVGSNGGLVSQNRSSQKEKIGEKVSRCGGKFRRVRGRSGRGVQERSQGDHGGAPVRSARSKPEPRPTAWAVSVPESPLLWRSSAVEVPTK